MISLRSLLLRHRRALALGAVTLCFFVFANLRSPLPNDDGVLYLMLAERISEGGLAAGFDLFDRPLYSGMIAGLHAITGLSLITAAQLLNAGCVLGMVAAFVLLCRELYDDPEVMPWAAALFLLHPKLNNYFAFVIRDLGYWALLLGSFVLLLRNVTGGGRLRLAGWALCILLAAAFKPEALAFGLVLPLALLWKTGWRGARDAAFAWALLLLPLAAAALLMGTRAGALAPPARELPQLPGELLAAIPTAFTAAAERYATLVLDPQSNDVAAWSLAGGLLTILVLKLLNTLGPAQTLLLGLASRSTSVLPNPRLRVSFALIGACGVVMAGLFLAYRQFLDTRYVMIPSLLLLALAARGMQRMVSAARSSGDLAKSLLPAAIVLGLLVDFGLGLDRSKQHMLECVEWMRTRLPPGTHLFTNDRQLAAASNLRWDWSEVRDAPQMLTDGHPPLEPGVVWAIRLREGQGGLAQVLRGYADRLAPVTQFTGEKGDRIVLLKPLPETNTRAAPLGAMPETPADSTAPTP